MINKSIPKGGNKSTEGYITTLSRIKPLAPAFSLMEMMVVMLVVAVIMAIAAPMVTKKLNSASSGGASLLSSIKGGNIAYNTGGNTKAVIYGGNNEQIVEMGNYLGENVSYVPQLILNSKSPSDIEEHPHIGFMYSGSATGAMLVGNNNRIYIGNRSDIGINVENSVVIGQGIQGQSGSVLIGGMFPPGSDRSMSASSAVAIGHNVNAGSSAVTIGADSSTNVSSGDPGFVAVGTRTTASENAVAIGYANASGSGSVAISGQPDAETNPDDAPADASGGGVAIGRNSVSGGGLALGHNANTNGRDCDALGTGARCANDDNYNDALYIAGRSGFTLNSSDKLSLTANHASIGGSTTLRCENTPVTVTGERGLTSGSSSGNHVSAYQISAGTVTSKWGQFENIDKMLDNLEKTINSSSGSMSSIYHGVRLYLYDSEVVERIEREEHHCICPEEEEEGEGGANSGLAKFAFWEKNKSGAKCCKPDSILAYNYSSDERLKDIIGENLDAMDKINRLKVYDFTFKDDESKTKHVGVIAQDLRKVFPNAVEKGKDGYLHIRHEDIFYAMVNSLKELDAKIKQLVISLGDNKKIATKNKIAISELQTKVDTQGKDIAEMKERVANLKISVKKLAR